MKTQEKGKQLKQETETTDGSNMSQTNGKLSSRVMNMKFMRFTKQENTDDNDVISNEEEKKSISHDNSQWNFTGTNEDKQHKRRIVLKKKRNVGVSAPQRTVVGITELKREDNSIVRGRRIIGEAKKDDHDDDDKTNKRERGDDKAGEDDDYDLDKIFKQVKDEKKKKPKKR